MQAFYRHIATRSATRLCYFLLIMYALPAISDPIQLTIVPIFDVFFPDPDPDPDPDKENKKLRFTPLENPVSATLTRTEYTKKTDKTVYKKVFTLDIISKDMVFPIENTRYTTCHLYTPVGKTTLPSDNRRVWIVNKQLSKAFKKAKPTKLIVSATVISRKKPQVLRQLLKTNSKKKETLVATDYLAFEFNPDTEATSSLPLKTDIADRLFQIAEKTYTDPETNEEGESHSPFIDTLFLVNQGYHVSRVTLKHQPTDSMQEAKQWQGFIVVHPCDMHNPPPKLRRDKNKKWEKNPPISYLILVESNTTADTEALPVINEEAGSPEADHSPLSSTRHSQTSLHSNSPPPAQTITPNHPTLFSDEDEVKSSPVAASTSKVTSTPSDNK